MRTTPSGMAGMLLLLAGATLASAQEFRATIGGRVTDPGDLPVPGVVVSALNAQTNQVASATTTTEGTYTIPFLQPGAYTVTAEIQGFRKHVQEKVEAQVGTNVTLDIQLQIGGVLETVTVVSESVDATRADRGMVIDNARVTELPLNARNPFMLSYLAPGITYNGPAIYQRPFDNGAIADWSINGGQNRNNEFLLDGAPNNAVQGGNNIAYVPPVEAVQEFKIVTNSYDAQYGRTAGGVINVSLKSGTNQMHGSIYEFARRRAFDSNEYLFKATGREKPDHKLDQYGFQLDGPVRIPGVYDGQDKTFFMFQYEGYDEVTPNPTTLTFPTQAQINGDFSNLRDAQGNLIVIYDPATGRQVGNQWVRDPFPGNIIQANRINPVAQKLLSHYPRPNTTAASGDPWRNNFTFAPNLAVDDFYNIAAKVDQNISDKTRMFFSYGKNKRTETRYTNGILAGPAQDGQLPLQRLNDRIVADWVQAGSTVVWNVRTSVNQYVELARSDPGLGFDVTELGLPGALASQLPNKAFPRVNVTDYTQLGRNNNNRETTTVWSFQPNLSYVKGTHNVRAGLDLRTTWYTRESNGNLFVLNVDRRYTQRLFNQAEALSGNSIASLLLGAPNGGAVDNNFFPEFRWNYSAPWIQDDWRIGNRLTVNLGLRWDLNSPVFEEQNRLNYGFNTTDTNPVTSRIDRARFPGYGVRGGVEFVETDGNPRYPYKWDKNNIQPRAGFAYTLTDRTILRGGYGKYFLNVTGTTTSNGFSIQTPLIGSLDDHRTPTYALSNPFPNGIAEAPGAAGGLLTFLGRGPNFSNPDYDNPYVHQFSLGVQRMLPWRTTVEASYVGSRTRQEQNSWGGFNNTPLELRNRCDPTQGGTVAFCNELLPNPFFGVSGFEGTARFTSPTLSRAELSRPFPQFTDITMFERNDGRIWYNSAQFVVSKRASSGLTINGTYTLSQMIEENGFRDDTAMIVQKSPYTTDRRHRATVSGVWNLPFGHEERFGSSLPAALNAVLGGWEMAGMFLYNSGRPWDLPGNVFYVRDAKLPEIERSGNTIRGVRNCVARMSDTGVVTMQTFSVAAGCTEPNFIIRPNFTGRTTNFRDDDILRPSFAQFDMNFAKMTRLSDRLRLQLRIELFNVLNWEMYDERQYVNDPNNALFGAIDRTVTRQSNFPRYGQLGIKLLF